MLLRYSLLLLLLTTATLCSAQPANDECATAITVMCGDIVQGNTSTAGPDEATNCGTTIGAPGVWYRLDGTGVMVNATTC
ncbi:MAG TPA: hypothetical protein PK760_13875, partial [Flavobacteriales bacterium]|nr:hypothetical protein [Flavobacteriales bacterium]